MNKRQLTANTVKTANKGQVTVFIIVGLVLVLIIAGTLFILQSQTETELKSGISEIESQLNAGKYNSFIQGCIEQNVARGVKELGEKGGNFTVNTGQMDFAVYGIKYNSDDDEYGISNYGANTLLPLCPKATKCHSDAIYPDESLQEKLEEYVNQNIEECFNSIFEQIKQFKPELTDKSISVKLTRKNIVTTLRSDIKLKSDDAERVISLDEIQIRQPLRFRMLHEIAYWMIEKEISNISFDLSKYSADLVMCYGFCLDENIRITKERLENNDYLITIHDDSSLVEGEPLSFSFTIDNRPPINLENDVDNGECNVKDPDDQDLIFTDEESCSYTDGEYEFP